MNTSVAPRRRRRRSLRAVAEPATSATTTAPVVELEPEQVVRWDWWLAVHGWPEGWS